MSEKALDSLQVIELPYLPGHGFKIRRSQGWRELDDYKLCGVYQATGVPVEIGEPNWDKEIFPECEEECFAEYGRFAGRIAEMAATAFLNGKAVLMTGADCRQVVGLCGGLRQALGPEKRLGIIYLDAHGDFNTPETTLSGMLGGMPLAVCAGLCCEEWRLGAGLEPPVDFCDIIMSDGRNLDKPEEELMRSTAINYLDTAAFLDNARWKQAVEQLAEQTDAIVLHIDVDILDGELVPNHSTRENCGPGFQETAERIRCVMDSGKVAAYSLLSVYHETGRSGQDISTINSMRLMGAGLDSWKCCPDLKK